MNENKKEFDLTDEYKIKNKIKSILPPQLKLMNLSNTILKQTSSINVPSSLSAATALTTDILSSALPSSSTTSLLKYYKSLFNSNSLNNDNNNNKLNENRFKEIPKPINKLIMTHNKNNLNINEFEYNHLLNYYDVNDECSSPLSNSTNNQYAFSLLDNGYLNLYIHYAYVNSNYFNKDLIIKNNKKSDKKKFYLILRIDNEPIACTSLGTKTIEKMNNINDKNVSNCTNMIKICFNEHFIINLNSINKQFDFIMCSKVKYKKKKLIENESDDKKIDNNKSSSSDKEDEIEDEDDNNNDDNDDDSMIIKDLFLSNKFNFEVLFSTNINHKLCIYMKRVNINENNQYMNSTLKCSTNQATLSDRTLHDYISTSSTTVENEIDVYLYINMFHLNEYSLIKQIFSTKLNSKLLSLPLDDKNCRFNLVLQKLICEIETRGGLYEPYLYKLNVSLSDVKWMLLQLERDCLDIIQTMPDIHVIASNVYQ